MEKASEVTAKGILLLALGHSEYGKMALNLALSLKANSDIKIALVHDNSAIRLLSKEEKAVFDELIVCPMEYYKGSYFRTKLKLCELSPFEKTIYLDVDTLILPGNDINKYFDELEGNVVTFSNRGFIDLNNPEGFSIWCDINEIKEKYSLKENQNKYYSLHSEFIYFTKKAKGFFDKALSIYDKPKITPVKFANGYADEFAFSIACMLKETYPHKDNFIPAFWYPAERKEYKPSYLNKNYLMISMGGNRQQNSSIAIYNNLVKHYVLKSGLNNIYLFKNKFTYLPERSKI